MKILRLIVPIALLSIPAFVIAQQGFQITPAMQAEIDRQKAVVAEWAADPTVVSAVREQNARGPLPEMDNPRWKVTRRSDPLVKGFQGNAAGRFLHSRLQAAGGTFSEAFLSASRGEKVAFVEKTTSYIHVGSAKFDVPFGTGKSWQGKPEFDESSQTYAVQVAVPILADGKTIGVLVAGINLSHLEKVARK
jgi:hypothetical protein